MRIANHRQFSERTATVAALLVSTIFLFASEDSMGFLDRFLEPRKGSAEYHYQQGIDAFYFSSFKDAVEEFSLAINLNSAFIDAYYFRGMVYTFLREYERAISDFDYVLKHDPKNAGASFWKSTASSEKRHEDIVQKVVTPDETGVGVAGESAADIIGKLLAFIQSTNNYRSNLVFKDLQSEELKDNENIFMRWYFDYEKPNSFSVTQISSTEDIDKWVSLGNQNTRMAWFHTFTSERSQQQADLESFLHIGKYVELLSQFEQDDIGLQLVNNGEFYFLQTKVVGEIELGNWSVSEFRKMLTDSLYHLIGKGTEDGYTLEWWLVPTISETDPPRSIGVNKDLSIVESSVSVDMKLWITTDDYAPYRAQILIKGELENNQPITYMIDQVFSDYNSGVEVFFPPSE